MDGLMIDDNPQGNGDDGAVVSEQDTMDALTDILDEPETENEEDEVPADDEPKGVEAEDENGEDADDEESEDSDEDASDEEDDGPGDELKGGRFAPHSAKVRLPDGRTTTVEDLVQGGMRQSDYSRKTESLARERDEFETDRQRYSQASQELEQQREFISAVMEQWKPQPPENPQNADEWMEFQQREHAWNQWNSHINENLQKSREKLEESQRDETKKMLLKENERLIQAIPAMSDPTKRQRIFSELQRFGGAEYGFSAAEIVGITDHRMIRALFDLQQAKARTAKAPEAVKKVSKKPRVMHGSNRSKDKNSAKRSRMERLRETGSARDAEAALRDLDL